MRISLGVLLLGGTLALIGAMMGQRQRRSLWRTIVRRSKPMMNMMNMNQMMNMFNMKQMRRQGRRLIRNMGWR